MNHCCSSATLTSNRFIPRLSLQGALLALFVGFLALQFFLCEPTRADELLAADMVEDNQPIDITQKPYVEFFAELKNKHNFQQEELIKLFSELKIDKKVLQLMDKQWEGKPYYQYRPLFITPLVIAAGKTHLMLYSELFDRIEKQYGVDREVIVAIWAIESRFGTNQGNFQIFRTLNTLFAAYPRRADFFRKELISFLLLCRNNNIDPLSVEGSYAGAFGQAQFMPSSFISYAQDFDGDNKKDIINSLADIFASIANYLHRYGWVMDAPVYAHLGTTLRDPALAEVEKLGRKGRVNWRQLADIQKVSLPRPPHNGQLAIIGLEKAPDQGGGFDYVAGYPNFLAITEYNHSTKYAMAVAEMIDGFKN